MKGEVEVWLCQGAGDTGQTAPKGEDVEEPPRRLNCFVTYLPRRGELGLQPCSGQTRELTCTVRQRHTERLRVAIGRIGRWSMEDTR